MNNVLNQSIGIDIAKDSFVACICTKHTNQSFSFSEARLFKNEKNGFNQLMKWVRKNTVKSTNLLFAMETTGVYFEPLAFHLCKIKCRVSVVLPNKVKYYAKSLNIKSKNDFIDAKIIAQMAADRELQKWTPPNKTILKLRSLTRLNNQLQDQRHVLCNMMHSKKFAVETPKEVLRTTQKIIDTI